VEALRGGAQVPLPGGTRAWDFQARMSALAVALAAGPSARLVLDLCAAPARGAGGPERWLGAATVSLAPLLHTLTLEGRAPVLAPAELGAGAAAVEVGALWLAVTLEELPPPPPPPSPPQPPLPLLSPLQPPPPLTALKLLQPLVLLVLLPHACRPPGHLACCRQLPLWPARPPPRQRCGGTAGAGRPPARRLQRCAWCPRRLALRRQLRRWRLWLLRALLL
jgi:hypothetical protein